MYGNCEWKRVAIFESFGCTPSRLTLQKDLSGKWPSLHFLLLFSATFTELSPEPKRFPVEISQADISSFASFRARLSSVSSLQTASLVRLHWFSSILLFPSLPKVNFILSFSSSSKWGAKIRSDYVKWNIFHDSFLFKSHSQLPLLSDVRFNLGFFIVGDNACFNDFLYSKFHMINIYSDTD